MKVEDVTTFRPDIIAHLKKKAGDIVTPKMMGTVLNIGEASAKNIMLAMESEGSIRKGKTLKNLLCFYIPTEQQLVNEAMSAAKDRGYKPLRSNPEKARLIEEIRRQREQFPSIG